MTKVVTVEVVVTSPTNMDSETVTEGVDHILDVGGTGMSDKVINWFQPPAIDAAIAATCVQMVISESKGVDSVDDSEMQYDPREREATKD